MRAQQDAVRVGRVDVCNDVASRELLAFPSGDDARLLLNFCTKRFEAFNKIVATKTMLRCLSHEVRTHIAP